ncbi:xanthine dehydrogenase family protein molybdopterin-binding subunit [Dyadobacter psychrophilus]|uniref:Isoquinoline 1-oxidoreductase, beta subunit n=1 Tax=Dyadobacter psychrophilus TaxID=651661 RepID=A0A1T5EUU2_9BACT|nr:xanthine dehydrogenase family protein molybdopterin-binding subunit [Dyadobacter psychrophilus]SKB87510.1 isoquinoline 1-oxidoreductase, beta subunit [Dyadobacter psychrophilus]
MRDESTLNRRNFIKNSGIGIGGLIVGFSFSNKAMPSRVQAASADGAQLHAYLRISEDNVVHIVLPKVEMGQGIWTTIPMLIAEELDCDWDQIRVESSKPGREEDFRASVVERSTGGSESTVNEFDKCRQAGAAARLMLINAAAKRFGVLPEHCKTEAGYVISGTQRLSYGALAREAATLKIPSEVLLKDPRKWKYIGKSKKRLDTPEKITGKAVYGMDIQFPGLLTAVVAHPPVFGAKVKSFDAVKASQVHGVRQVLEIPSGIAVIADHYWSAKKGRDALTIEWDPGKASVMDSETLLQEYRELAKTKGALVAAKGNVMQALAESLFKIEAEFSFPYLAHAPMEPLNCTVRIGAESCEVWTGTQSPLQHQIEIGAFLGLKPEQVLLHTPYLGGSFGRRGSFNSDWIMEAVHIAKASGKFIKLVWSREDDIRGGYYRPAYVHNVQIGIDNAGFPSAWHHSIVGQSLFTGTPLESLIAPNGIDYSSVTRAAPYSNAFKDYSFELHTTSVNIPVLAWRSVGATHTTFVVETLIDELATKAGMDPVEYRRILLRNAPRHLSVLNLAAGKAGWGSPLPLGRFRGVAVCEAMASFVCQIVELSVEDKQITVHKVVCAIDCGLAVNPDGVRAQMEGGIVYGLTAALFGEITIKDGEVQQSNFHDYRVMRMNEMPVIEVHIAESAERMGGAGEPGVAPIAAALANALFAAVGKRVRQLPIQLGDV